AIPRSYFFDLGYTQNIATIPAAHAANVVFAATRPIPAKSSADSVDPGLNPYQPNQRITVPIAPRFRSCGGRGPPPSRLNFRPSRGPSTMAPASAMNPPTVWTTVAPAQSRKTAPFVELLRECIVIPPSQPPGRQTQ